MIDWSQAAPYAVTAFLASLVEFVEALTIVLAVGTTRGWRPALMGAATGTVVLVVLVLALGPALEIIPIAVLQMVVGTLLLLFGMRWLRKAILRAVGVIALHDEAQFSTTNPAPLKVPMTAGSPASMLSASLPPSRRCCSRASRWCLSSSLSAPAAA